MWSGGHVIWPPLQEVVYLFIFWLILIAQSTARGHLRALQEVVWPNGRDIGVMGWLSW